ncbi:Klaroid protein [Pseudolycoriella hygida]|uniref:Klaroid protein n=1 Tax=Pseudolycoriella hygida TaxID=35572 RepID=A0A9Q0S5Q9_9DIPT|nr:Klaroid protein [Pseudolycoriella hygida]
MSEQLVPENRNRSRSKTPFHLRSQCDGENCNEAGHVHAPKKKSPTVTTITEEPESPAVSSKTTTNNVIVTRTVVHSTRSTDSNNFESQNSNQNSIQASLSSTIPIVTVPATTTTTTKVQTKSNQSDQRTVLKSKRILSSRTEINENIVNNAHERITAHSTPKKDSSGSSRISPNILENVNLNDHLPYKEYKEAGEYWKRYPKTDYTYSTTYSPFRREIKPGVIAMPNMSRRSLDHHQDRINEMALNNPTQESYIRSRYQSTYEKYKSSNNYIDSQDEVDEIDYRSTSNRYNREERSSIVKRFFTAIFTFIFACWHKTGRIFTSETDYRNVRYTRLNENRGIFSRAASSIKSTFLSIFRYIYLTIATIQFWDSCFLQSSNAERRGKKRFLLLLLLLLPLLLLAGLYHYYDKPLPMSNISSSAFSDYINENVYLDTSLRANETDQPTIAALHVSLPLFLQSIKTIGYDFAASTKSVKSFFDFNWNLPFIYHSHSTTNNFPHSTLLSDQQYADLIKHIDAYIEHIITQQSQTKQNLSPEANNILVASIVKENIRNYKYQLTLEDIERIANAVREKLRIEETESKLNIPLDQHREFIANVVKENVNLHLTAPKDDVNSDGGIDEILVKLFGSAKFIEIIDQEIVNHIEPHQQKIGVLENTIQFMADKLSDKTLENQDLKYSLDVLRRDHEQLLGNLNANENDIDIKLANLLKEVDLKFGTFQQNQFPIIDNHVKVILMDIMGYEFSSDKPGKVDLKKWIQNVFVAKTYLEQRLSELSLKFDKDLKAELDRSAVVLMKNVGEQIKSQTLLMIQNSMKSHEEGTVGALDELKIKDIVREVLAIYDADKTGLVDYALESAGGEVLSTRCTENYRAHYQLSIFGIPIPYNYQSNTPRTAISPTVQPGNCWSFQGFPGFLVLKLNTFVFVTGFTMEHIPKTLAPNGKIDSAPKNFSVWGLEHENDHEPIEFGKYTFLENGTSLQYFSVQNADEKKAFNVVELRIESNHGNQNYTCLYRFRVHGHPDT